jgi:hypothetical protein
MLWEMVLSLVAVSHNHKAKAEGLLEVGSLHVYLVTA